ncbi:hypothetical protein EMPS_06279 [Entomortierella parvispora]|uniref:AAA+ ATPase domain-containing protein n=1 Tax=Entomortierella parvispora TaxID=205924 RepID=A0A9P3HC88_9FUNG|nr:hypothetical protein EMPS_06279 [Entomortierella parvispora]
MLLRVIASIDETSRLDPSHVSGARHAAPSARLILYVARDQGLQLKLRNVVVALKTVGPNPSRTIHASVKFYSKESTLFRKDPRFPDKLGTHHDGTQTSETIWNVVVTNLLWWELQQLQSQGLGTHIPFQEDKAMPLAHPPLVLTAEVINGIGNATSLTLTGSFALACRQNGAAVAQSLTGFVLSLNGIVSFKSPYGSQSFTVSSMETTNQNLSTVGIMSESTSIHFNTSFTPTSEQLPLSNGLISKERWVSATRKDIGGYDDILEQIVHHMYGFLEGALQPSESRENSSCFQAPCKGILITGRPGTGKSLLASKLAEHSGLPCTVLNCPDVFQTDEGASENFLRNSFSSLLTRGPASILILDEVDMIASGRSSRKGVEAKLFATLLHLIDSINMQPQGNKIFIIALTNRPHAVDASLVRSGRLDKIFDLHLKGVEQRRLVLEIITKDLPLDMGQKADMLTRVARVTHGFVPTDLQALCTQAALQLISKIAAGHKDSMIDFSYFEQALKNIRPSGMGEFLSKIPTVTFNDLYGVQDAIADLKVSIIEPFHNPRKYLDLGISPPRGVLVHGPPGVGKTMLCCALAEELGINFMLVESSQIRSKVVGESEQNIAKMFAQAKANAPCILFIDQIDVLAPSRGSTHTSENSGDRIVTGLLTEMDGFFSGGSDKKGAEVDVLVLAATNRPEVIDTAILRPGRLDQIVHIPVPDAETRTAILSGYIAKMPVHISSDEVKLLAEQTEGYSGADLENLCREAALICLRQDIKNTEIKMEHLQAAKQVSKPSLLGYEDSSLFLR